MLTRVGLLAIALCVSCQDDINTPSSTSIVEAYIGSAYWRPLRTTAVLTDTTITLPSTNPDGTPRKTTISILRILSVGSHGDTLWLTKHQVTPNSGGNAVDITYAVSPEKTLYCGNQLGPKMGDCIFRIFEHTTQVTTGEFSGRLVSASLSDTVRITGGKISVRHRRN